MHWFGDVTSRIDKQLPLVRINCAQIQWLGAVVVEQNRPMPDICRTVSCAGLTTLATDMFKVNGVERMLRDTRNQMKPDLCKLVGGKNGHRILPQVR